MRPLLTNMVLAAIIVLSPAAFAQQSPSGRAQDANDLLQRAINELKIDRGKALAKFNTGENGFKDNNIRLFCSNPEGILVSHNDRTKLGQDMSVFRDRTGKAYGKEIMYSAAEGRITEVDYVLVRRVKNCGRPASVRGRVVPTGCPGIRISVPTRSLVTKVGDLVCGVEFSVPSAQGRRNQGQGK